MNKFVQFQNLLESENEQPCFGIVTDDNNLICMCCGSIFEPEDYKIIEEIPWDRLCQHLATWTMITHPRLHILRADCTSLVPFAIDEAIYRLEQEHNICNDDSARYWTLVDNCTHALLNWSEDWINSDAVCEIIENEVNDANNIH